AVVVDVLKIPGRQRRGHDEGRGPLDGQLGEPVAHRHGGRLGGADHVHSTVLAHFAPPSVTSAIWRSTGGAPAGRHAYRVHGSVPNAASSAGSPGMSRYSTSTSIPIRTSAGSMSRSSPSMRTPSSSSTSAMTNGNRVRPGTRGAWWVTKLYTVPRPEETT